jgi:hypothetical protein
MTTIHSEQLHRVMGGVARASDPDHTRSTQPAGSEKEYGDAVRQQLKDGLGLPGSGMGKHLEYNGDAKPSPGNPYYGTPGGTDV